MRFARADMRDHIVSHKNDHGSSYRRYRALQRQRGLKLDFREIFGVVRISTFATVSAQNGHGEAGRRCLLLRLERTCRSRPATSVYDPKRTSETIPTARVPPHCR